jgi:hypothetical protein
VYKLSDEHTWSFSGKYDVGGKRFFTRGTNVFTADFLSYTQQGEVSTDGKTWVPGWEQKAVKPKPAPNK